MVQNTPETVTGRRKWRKTRKGSDLHSGKIVLAKNIATGIMIATPLHRQLFDQLNQWIIPKDLRHLTNCAEIVAAIISAESASLAHWIPYLSHRDCQARSHLARLSYFMHNPQINQELFYRPLLKQFLQEWSGEELVLVIDTSMFWDTYCLIEVCTFVGWSFDYIGSNSH